MDDVLDQLLAIEIELADGSGDPYRRHLADDAIIDVPGAVMTREACAAAMDESPGWDEREISDERLTAVGREGAVLTYRWRSRRGDQTYAAVMSSVYARNRRRWRLMLYQQTPEPA